MNIVIDYTDSVPAGFAAAFQTAVNFLDAEFLNPITVTLNFSYANLGGNTLADAGPDIYGNMTYSQIVAQLTAAPGADKSFLADLPPDPTNGGLYLVTDAEAKAWGLLSPNSAEVDGVVNFSNAFNWDYTNTGASGTYSLYGVALHELTHALGRVTYNGAATVMNLMTYGDATGKLDTTTADPRYFSVDGGKTNIAAFDSSSDPADFSGTTDPFNAFINPNRAYQWSGADSTMMRADGFNVAAPTHPAGATDQVVNITASNTTMSFMHGEGDFIQVSGNNDTVYIGSGADDEIHDTGQGLNIAPASIFANLDVTGFRFDLRGHITLAQGDTVASLGPDGHGGTRLQIKQLDGPAAGSLIGASQIDFKDDPFVTMAQIS